MNKSLKKLLTHLRKARPYLQSVAALIVITRWLVVIIHNLVGR
jgi:hypothetical protein